MDPETPVTDNCESACLNSQLLRELQQPQPVYLPTGELVVTIFPQENQRRWPSSVVPTNEPAFKGIGAWRLRMNPLKALENPEARIKDGRFDKIVVQKLESNQPGYPRLARFIVSDVDYNMYRSFARLRAHSLLHKQAELTEFEEQLEDLDKSDAKLPETKWKLHSHINTPGADNGTRKELMDKIDLKMKEYDDLLLRFNQIQALRKPSKRLHRGLFNYVFNRHPVTPKDERFIYQKDDFVMVAKHSEFNWLDDVFQRIIDYDSSNILKSICITPEDRNRTTDPFIHYFSRSRFGTIMSTITAFLSTILLMTPVYVLITVPMNMQKMATVVLGFVFLFAAALSTYTDARRFDIFIATATYSAVLMVFLGNYQQNLKASTA